MGTTARLLRRVGDLFRGPRYWLDRAEGLADGRAAHAETRADDRADGLTSVVVQARLHVEDRLGAEADRTRHELADVTRVEAAGVLRLLQSWGLDPWRIDELEGLLRYQRRRAYEDDIAARKLLVPELHTDSPGAPDTDDSRFPYGAVNDNSICPRFNARLAQMFPDKPRLAVLDLGCAGGGFVRSLLDEGHLAVGLEGCDLPRLRRLGEWGTIPRHLHTCDITRPFRLTHPATGDPIGFDAITMWEVLEHIPEPDLPQLADNIAAHLAPGGVWIASVSTVDDGDPTTGAVYHHTVRPREWWADRFAALGFAPVARHPIGRDDWLRGSANCRFDRHAESEGVGFHVVLRPAGRARPVAARTPVAAGSARNPRGDHG